MKAVSNNTEATRFDDSILKDGRKEVISIYAIPDRKLGLFINLSVFIKLLRTKAMSRQDKRVTVFFIIELRLLANYLTAKFN